MYSETGIREVYSLYLIRKEDIKIKPLSVIGLDNVIEKAKIFTNHYDRVRVTLLNSNILIYSSDDRVVTVDLGDLPGTLNKSELLNFDDKEEEYIDDGPFYIYGLDDNGRYGKPRILEYAEDAVNLALDIINKYKEVIIADSMDSTVFHAVNGEVVFPDIQINTIK